MNGSSIFKKVFPVVLVIAMICLITLVTTCAKTGKPNKPEISNPNGEYISIKETGGNNNEQEVFVPDSGFDLEPVSGRLRRQEGRGPR